MAANTTPTRNDRPCKLDLTPMIDIIFLLLVFFILTGKFRDNEGRFDVWLPEDGRPPIHAPLPPERIRIHISRSPSSDKNAPPDIIAELGESSRRGAHILDPRDTSLESLRALAGPDARGVIIVAESRIRFQWIIKAIDASARAGLTDIAFAAPIEPRGEPQ